MPNIIAYIAITLWPLVILFLLRLYGFHAGILMSLLGSYMFLPAAFEIDFPGIPPLDKFTVTSITVMAYMLLTGSSLGIRSLSKFMKWVLFAFLVSPFLTAVTNGDAYQFLPGLNLYDGLSMSASDFLYFFPFLVGAKYFRSYERQLLMFKYFVVAAVLYSLLALYEVRMSPQLHNIVYGYFPHSWLQHYRDGGFRAIVFMGHGLHVAFFISLGLAFMTTMKKAQISVLLVGSIALLLFLFIALVLSKSYAALILGIFAYFMISFVSVKRMHQATVLIAALFVTYPILSTTDVFPHGWIIEKVSQINEERAESLAYRFEQEETLLAKANLKPFFGWGSWGRNRVYDVETGQDVSVTDGKWILTFGTRGWFGFIAEFLFILIPIGLAYKISKKGIGREFPKNERLLFASHALIVSIILVYQLPNSSLNPLYWFVIGALLGRSEFLLANEGAALNKKADG